MRLRLPFRLALELGSEMRLPEGDVTDPANAEDGQQFRFQFLQIADLLGVVRQLILQCEVALFLRHRMGQRAFY